jgi:NAD(P)H-dependent flavin oxidoreductase YrpB (nitropropane dioxygenase family)
MGSMDVDAAIVTAGGLPESAITAELAALALGGTILANMAVKLGVTLAYARGKGVAAALALGASMVALAASLLIGWMRLSG